RENTVFSLPGGLLAAVYRDTTFEETSKVGVKESEEKFRSLVEGSNDAVFVHPFGADARPGNFIEVNTAACERLGYSREELMRMGPADVDAGGMDEERGKALEKLGREGRAIFEMTHRSRTGETIPVEVSARRFEYKGKPHIVSIARDIRDLRRTEAALRKSEETFRHLVENAPDGIFIQLEEKLEYLNPEAVRILGAGSEDELKGTSIFDRFHPDFHDTVRERVDLLMKEKKRVPEIEEVCLRLDGSRFPAMISAVPFEKDGKKGAIVTIRDITERKRMEEDLLKSQKIESLGMLAGGIAHDFNNILTGITANLSMLLSRTGRQGDEGEALNEALAAANTAKGLTRQLLAFSEGGKPVKKEIDAGKAVSEAAHLALRGTPCSLDLKVAPDLWSIEADETQLAQVIVNLCSNAAQAMPGGGRLIISAANAERGGDPFIEVSVADAGTGIPGKYLESIFDPYFTTKKQGHGLGLPMAYSIVKGHGGEISVVSESGKGSIFTISLPATGRRPGPAAAPAAAPVSGSGRILVMDDEEVVLKAARRMITSLGYECALAEDGAGALAIYDSAAAEGNPFDAVIMDLTIQGGMGGREAVAELRKKHPGAKVIASSGYAAGTPVSEYAAMGFDGLLAKPYNYEELASLLKKLTSGDK
ncbi:MAG: PAS domain S-box protein, partial [Elusimicrobiales bacterium]|nr:PAS domain S-box protein [Elusimicrobiales bacterium]